MSARPLLQFPTQAIKENRRVRQANIAIFLQAMGLEAAIVVGVRPDGTGCAIRATNTISQEMTQERKKKALEDLEHTIELGIDLSTEHR